VQPETRKWPGQSTGPDFLGSTADPSIPIERRMPQLLILARALACPTRLFLLQLLGEDGMHLGQAAEAAGVSPATASHHLGVLVDAGLAIRQRRGRRCKYTWGPTRWALVCTGPLGSK